MYHQFFFHKQKSLKSNKNKNVVFVLVSRFHKSSYERFLLYEFVEPVLNYGCSDFVALTNLFETGPRSIEPNI